MRNSSCQPFARGMVRLVDSEKKGSINQGGEHVLFQSQFPGLKPLELGDLVASNLILK